MVKVGGEMRIGKMWMMREMMMMCHLPEHRLFGLGNERSPERSTAADTATMLMLSRSRVCLSNVSRAHSELFAVRYCELLSHVNRL